VAQSDILLPAHTPTVPEGVIVAVGLMIDAAVLLAEQPVIVEITVTPILPVVVAV
jgi:hypothetical protein